MKQIYTAGYSGHSPAQLQKAGEDMDAIVLDIRCRPYSRQTGWSGSDLSRLLGKRYRHLAAWGNVNYSDAGGIQLANPVAGCDIVKRLSQENPVILLCGCREFEKCHRKTCSDLLGVSGIATTELSWPEIESDPGQVKCISLWQPWATLMALGHKRIETRSWSTPYRGPLVIHAAKTLQGFADLFEEVDKDEGRLPFPFDAAFRDSGYSQVKDVPLGAAVCVVDLIDCVKTDDLYDNLPFWRDFGVWEESFGNYERGRYAWITQEVKRFPTPIPLCGRQGLWSEWFDINSALRGECGRSPVLAHHCHAQGCEVEVPPSKLMCANHWRMVPRELQRCVWNFYRDGQEVDKKPSPEYVKAARAAIDSVALQETKGSQGSFGF